VQASQQQVGVVYYSARELRERRTLRGLHLKSIRAWLGIDTPETQEFAPLRETLGALDHLEPERARYLAALAYLKPSP